MHSSHLTDANEYEPHTNKTHIQVHLSKPTAKQQHCWLGISH